MTEGSRYFAAGWNFDEEQARLRLVEEIHDPATLRHVANLGLSAGWQCLEVGAGAGSIARARPIASDHPATSSPPTSIRASYMAFSNLEVREHDIRSDEVEHGAMIWSTVAP